MKILVVNCGSSSLKYQLIDMTDNEVLASGKCDRIGVKGIESPYIEYKNNNGDKIKKELDLPNHTVAFEEVVKYLLDEKVGAIKELSEINGIGHRIVNGGPKFTGSVLVTDEVMEEYTKAIEYAPLHNPAHIQGINACTKIMPNIPQVLVFDTSFHTTIPDKAAIYAIPYEYYEKYGIKRYGAHGTSHKYITKQAAKVLGKNKEDINIISCHLGNGASIAAVKKGKCVDTSMGLTPLEGLVMGTRSGDLDPAVLEFVMKKENINIDEMMTILNKKSGLLGISGITGDIRDLKGLIAEGNEKANISAINNIGYYEFSVKNFKDNKISETGFKYVIEVVSKTDDAIKVELYKEDEPLKLDGQKTEEIMIAGNEKIEQKYKLKVTYDSNKGTKGKDILEEVQLKIHSEQMKIG